VFFFCFRTGFRSTKGERQIQLLRRGMRTGQTLFPLGIEPDILWVCPWKERPNNLIYFFRHSYKTK
jgi:hypothetical protein